MGKREELNQTLTQTHNILRHVDDVMFSSYTCHVAVSKHVYLHGALEGVVVTGDIGHNLTLVRLLVS